MGRAFGRLWALGVACVLVFGAGLTQAADCEPLFASVVAVEGAVEWRRAGAAAWQATPSGAALCPGDTVRVGGRARAALRLANQTTLRLDQWTTLTIPPQPPGVTLLGLLQGALHVITRTPRRFQLQTPYVNAGVDGTEFVLRVEADATQALVIEGRVALTPAAGAPGRDLAPRGSNATSASSPAPAASAAPLLMVDGESAEFTGGQTAARRLNLRLDDAVRWALPYPVVLEGEAVAVAALQAQALLRVGRVDEAARLLDRVPAGDPGFAAALSLRSVIAVARNDAVAGERLAREALTIDPRLPGAQLALSYALQARFQLDAALAAAVAATEAAPGSAEAWARVAELRLHVGAIGPALAAAERARQSGPELARTATVHGFVQLLAADTAAAAGSFDRAAGLDPSDPLPRLGLGLARIRAGDLAGGREQIEIAVSLDPLDATLRSYLGKAYFEEGRGPLAAAQAAAQFTLARRFDPLDPTPWLYQALQARAENRPLDALRDIERSFELNDRRAVYRSRLLLDQDAATRQVGLAAIYGDLLADGDAIALASRSLDLDPANASAHRFLSDAYAARERHDIARTSEALQARLLQPPSLSPQGADLPFDELGMPGAFAGVVPFAFDPGSMFERDRLRFQAGVLGGTQGTTATRLHASTLQGPLVFGVGRFDYHTDGWRENADLDNRVSSMFAQIGLAPTLSAQLEHRERRTRSGDTAFRFDPQAYGPEDRYSHDERKTRVGATWRPAADTTWLVTAAKTRRRSSDLFVDDYADQRFDYEDHANVAEVQWLRSGHGWSIVAGGGRSRVRGEDTIEFDFTRTIGEACPVDEEPCRGTIPLRTRQRNLYVYWRTRPLPSIDATVGLSRDHFDDGEGSRVKRWNPKLGIRVALSPAWGLRAAWFDTLKRDLANQETLEPTQVAGFNQFYDDLVGSASRFAVLAADGRPSNGVSINVEAGRQRRTVGGGTSGVGFDALPEVRMVNEWMRLAISSRASASWVVAGKLSIDRYRQEFPFPTDWPTTLRTIRAPLTVRSFLPGGYYAEFVVTGVAQRVGRQPDSIVAAGRETFAVADASLGWRLPRRLGVVGLEVRNVFGARFRYQDESFRSTETRLSPLVPVRQMWVKVSLAL